MHATAAAASGWLGTKRKTASNKAVFKTGPEGHGQILAGTGYQITE
jgi:hypothetical protein